MGRAAVVLGVTREPKSEQGLLLIAVACHVRVLRGERVVSESGHFDSMR